MGIKKLPVKHLIFLSLVMLMVVRPGVALETPSSNLNWPPSINSGTVNSRDLPTPPCRTWIDNDLKPKVAVLCIHGLGLNSEAYNDFGTRLSHHGVAVYAIDVRGFGLWMKIKGGKDLDFERTLNDIKTTLETIHANHPGLPVFLLGESMGGAIVLQACSQYPQLIDGLISSAPGDKRYKQRRTNWKVGAKFLEGPRRQFDAGVGVVDQATQNMKLREIWEDSPLDRMDLSPIDLMKFQKFMDGTPKATKKIDNTPVLMLQGTLDKLVKATDSWDLFNDIASKKKTFIALPSEHLVLEFGNAKSAKYDARAARLVAAWIFANSPGLDEETPLTQTQTVSKP